MINNIITNFDRNALYAHFTSDAYREIGQAVTSGKEFIKELIGKVSQAVISGKEFIGKICKYEAVHYLAAGSLGVTFGPTVGLPVYNAFFMGASIVPVIQGTKAIYEGKTFEDAIKEVCNKPLASILIGLFAARAGSQLIGMDPYTSFVMGTSLIPIVMPLVRKVQAIKRVFSKIFNYIIQKTKDIFMKIYQFLADKLSRINKIIQRTFNKAPIQSDQPSKVFTLNPEIPRVKCVFSFEPHMKSSLSTDLDLSNNYLKAS